MDTVDADRASSIRLTDIVTTIALAADLALGQPLDHVLRSCTLATGFADHLGVSDDDRTTAYWVALFTSAGCTGVSFELSRIFGDDIALRAELGRATSTLGFARVMLGRAGADRSILGRTRVRAELLATKMRSVEDALIAHCRVSIQIATRMGLGGSVTSALAQSFTRWDGKGIPRDVSGEAIALPVRIAVLMDTIEVFHREQGVEAAIAAVRRLRGTLFDPALADAWCAVAHEQLAVLDEGSSWDAVMSGSSNRVLTEGEVDAALELLADYADLKSPWFCGHSRGVAELAEATARRMGLPDPDVTTMRRAALVHDIGRNGVPNSIWDKPGPLTDDERERVRLFAYHTGRILHRSGDLAFLASIASAAHERVDGSGYPRAIAGETIPLLGRILACADAYHAMGENRPHRPALAKRDIERELRRMALDGRLDGAATDALLAAAGHAPRKRPSAPAGLTPREVEVLELAARGLTTRQIGTRLGIAPKTAGNHIERIYDKIGVSSRAEAALFAMQNGLMRLPET
jgi:HD-GYP domain-containing protein (c-di-GMP phosphodiesterase class II)